MDLQDPAAAQLIYVVIASLGVEGCLLNMEQVQSVNDKMVVLCVWFSAYGSQVVPQSSYCIHL